MRGAEDRDVGSDPEGERKDDGRRERRPPPEDAERAPRGLTSTVPAPSVPAGPPTALRRLEAPDPHREDDHGGSGDLTNVPELEQEARRVPVEPASRRLLQGQGDVVAVVRWQDASEKRADPPGLSALAHSHPSAISDIVILFASPIPVNGRCLWGEEDGEGAGAALTDRVHSRSPGTGFDEATRVGMTEIGSASDVGAFIRWAKGVRARTRAVAERIPADRLEWSPIPGRFTPGDILRHIAATERWMWAENACLRPSRYPGHGPELARGKEAVLAYLDEMHAQTLEILGELSTADLNRKCRTVAGAEITVWKWLRLMIEHEVHHRGQLYEILGLLGVPVPPLYGLSEAEVKDKSEAARPSSGAGDRPAPASGETIR